MGPNGKKKNVLPNVDYTGYDGKDESARWGKNAVSRSIDEGKDEPAQSQPFASLSHSHPGKHEALLGESQGTAGKGTQWPGMSSKNTKKKRTHKKKAGGYDT